MKLPKYNIMQVILDKENRHKSPNTEVLSYLRENIYTMNMKTI